jgi:imidazolonepropionase-like amidohydrolase
MMVDAGLTRTVALQAATINDARVLGHEKNAGSRDAGKLADLVILGAKPLDDMRNVSRVFRVARGGTLFDPAQLLGTRVRGRTRTQN